MKYLIIFLFLFVFACTNQGVSTKSNDTNQVLKWVLRLNGVNK